MIQLTDTTVERWLSDSENFSYDFMRYVGECAKSVGVSLYFARKEIENAHTEWTTICADWQAHRFTSDAESLSYTKVFSILLYCLCKRTFITAMNVYKPSGRRSESEFAGTDIEKMDARRDLTGSPEVVSALDFCVAIIGFYEEARVDRVEPYRPNFTMSVRHDIIHMITTTDPSALDIYMALKPIFARV